MAEGQHEPQPFMAYPGHHLLAVVDEHDEAQRALDDLERAGFSRDRVMCFEGAEGAEEIDASGSGHGARAEVLRSIEHILADLDALDEYETAAREGRCVIGVPVRDHGERDRALGVLKRHGAHFANYYGAMTVETLLA